MTQITTYKPTFLQKLLGRNYKWWYFILYNFKAQRAYLVDTLLWTAYAMVSLFGSFFIWWITTKNNNTFDTAEILTYLFIGNLISSFISNWIEIDLGWMNRGGDISTKLLLPTSFLGMMYARYIGKNMLGNFPISILRFLIFFPVIKNYFLMPQSFWLILLTILILPISYTISFFANFSFGCFTFWITETDGANSFYGYFKSVLSGSVIPLTLLFPYIPFLNFQPFAFMLHHPMQIYLGKYSNLEILYTFLGGLAWCFILYLLAKWVFKMGLKKNESVGL
jgi:ABC-2 type transport system permease protein